MSWYGSWYDFAPRVPVGDKIAHGKTAATKLAKKEGREPKPVVIVGRKIAKTFWGLQWCDHLQRFRHIANRLSRGATYVRNGSVADLVIEPGEIRAVVAGSAAHTVVIKIKPLDEPLRKKIAADCSGEIHSLMDLLQGKFSDGVMCRLTRDDDGLFPRATDISMSCSCPDSASVCKHIAAVFYGVGARLDVAPELLFMLRQIDHLELIAQAASAMNLERALSSDDSSFSNADLGDLFGIELDDQTLPIGKKSAKAKSSAGAQPPGTITAKSNAKPIKRTAKQSVTKVEAPKTKRTTKTVKKSNSPTKVKTSKSIARSEVTAKQKTKRSLTAAKPAASAGKTMRKAVKSTKSRDKH